MPTIIRYKGKEPAAPPASDYWQPNERRTIDDKDEAQRLLQHPDFVEVKSKDDAAPDDAPPSDQQPAPEPTPPAGEEVTSA